MSKKPGKPPFTPTDEQRNIVELHAAFGTPQPDICALIKNPATGRPIDLKTLRLRFREELDQGEVRANAKVAQSLFRMAVGANATFDAKGNQLRDEQKPDKGAAIFWLKSRAGWREAPTQHNHTGAIGTYDLAKLSDDELERVEGILAKASAAGSAHTGGDQGGEGEAEG
jgi:hypothetical protein